jgi:carbon-monoxide dehydrogenase large subunit/6-hydroxypseudooxynicotine dehydrogenase subunit gamma
LEIILTEDFPAGLNPLGIKGAGESGITAVGAAIANAVEDAIGMPGAITELPITPQRLKALLDHRASLHPSNQAVLKEPHREGGLS